jgi:spore maturation protein CgeB
MSLRFVFLGLSITSSWGNGHATTYRGLVKSLAERGHDVTFLERDLPFYAANRDLTDPGRVLLYGSLEELFDRFADTVRQADVVIVGSYVPDGVAVGGWVQDLVGERAVFYDIDTPITLENLDTSYITRAQIPRYGMYLSFTGGPILERLERDLGSPCARALYCSVDPDVHRPSRRLASWDLGYVGTYSSDRQPALDRLLLSPSRTLPKARFVVAGPQYPEELVWPENVERIAHLPPSAHRDFYCGQRFTLNLTRRAMVAAGFSPSVRLFEAAACATAIVTDPWNGIEEIFAPDREILVARESRDVARILAEVPEETRIAIGLAARRRVLAEHTSGHRAEALERYAKDLLDRCARRPRTAVGRSAAQLEQR